MHDQTMESAEQTLFLKEVIEISVDEFKKMLKNKEIRPASLEDIWGTHHNRPIYQHPNTKQPFVKIR
jgi:hypothetical protein